MSDKAQLPFSAGKIKNSASLPTAAVGAAAPTAAAITATTSSDGLASHIRLSTIFAPLIDLNASGEQTTDYDSTTLHSLQSTMSSSSSSNPMSSHSDSYGQRQAIAANAAVRKISMGCRSMPTSPRLMPKQAHFYRPPASPVHNSKGGDRSNGYSKDSKVAMAQFNGSAGEGSSGRSNSGFHFSALTEHLNVQQVNNYKNPTGIREINWEERCLELQLELHRSKNQAERIRGMLRDKLSELEQRVIEAEGRAEEAEDKVRVMEQRLGDRPSQANNVSPSKSRTKNSLTSAAATSATAAGGATGAATSAINLPVEKEISQLEYQVEQQRLLRLKDAQQVEAKAAKIKEWVTNKLRELEQQNQLLREQNVKCNQQLTLLRNHLASQSSRNSIQQPVRNSLSLDVREYNDRSSRRRSESLDPPIRRVPLALNHRRNLSMEPQELSRDLAAAVDELNLISITKKPFAGKDANADPSHDYAEIYTPSREKQPIWLKDSGPSSDISNTFTSDVGNAPRAPTPPLHRFPSWEAKIYQVANDGLTSGENSNRETSNTLDDSTEGNRAQRTASGGYCDINVPVYATVKGRASQIRTMPFSDSSDDSSDGEDHVALATCTASTINSHNSSSTDNTESNTSGSASSPSKSAKTSSSLSPAKRIECDSPKIKGRGMSEDYAIPPDALSQADSTYMDASLPSILMRSSYVDSPNKKMESLEKSGHLSKLGGKLKTWRKRWFVLKNGTLTYWKSQHDENRKPQGQILLDETSMIKGRADGASTFEINTGKKVYYLTADSIATMDDWIRVLQNVQRRNATKLLLSRDDQKATVQGWVTKVKNGHAKKCWCVLLGKMFLYFKAPGETNPLGQINMRDARVEEVEHVSDSDSEEREDLSQSQAHLTIAIYPAHQGPTYLILPGKKERDNWLYHLTVVSGGGPSSGTQYEQLVQKLMETDGDATCVMWRHPILLHTKEPITSPLSSLHSEMLQSEAIKLFKSCQLFMSVAVNQPGIDYHVVLAQNALQQCLDMAELQAELICILAKQTSHHTSQKLGAGVQALPIPPLDCKSNPPSFTFLQGWQLLALAVSLFVPKNNRLLWYLKLHLSRNADSKSECGKYAAYCQRALERTIKNGGRETKPSRMEVLSILLKNPYHHSLPHAIPVHMMNGSYHVVSFDGSTTIEEFQTTLALEIGCRDSSNGFSLFSDDPIEKDLEHYLDPLAKLCDVISKWETALREKGMGKFENSRVIQLTYKNRLYWKHSAKQETDKEKILLCYQINQQVIQGRFPLTKDLALELASLMSQIDMGDYVTDKNRMTTSISLQVIDKFYPYRYRDGLSSDEMKQLQEKIISKWLLLKGRTTIDCVRIYLTCCRKWPFFGATLFQAKPRHSDQAIAWLAVSEDSLNVLELSTMAPLARYPYSSVMTFGGCLDDFMIVVGSEDTLPHSDQKLLFAMSKPKILEITLLIADYMNALGHTCPGTPQMNTLTRNGSHRSIRSRPLPSACTTAHNTLNSHVMHTSHTHTLNSSHGTGTIGSASTNSSAGHQHQQPDILKSTPDHQRIK
ncbi:uncharacterized protein CG43867 isoform X8 [Sitodiplosis mosellana]|uniref:uncharacterized protein CG43867 isoform X8 n=1 Tax=Sitodiplosis mosellana TaxID=263140 RepID=UPI0024443259|nr:uncharacterized protein CG43867 isoform X8 [Sitodiplosis mosellana]XP_055323231.1 uncharacterized protein CG43867 isoform X8 [Sitodiplosis mosellana]